MVSYYSEFSYGSDAANYPHSTTDDDASSRAVISALPTRALQNPAIVKLRKQLALLDEDNIS